LISNPLVFHTPEKSGLDEDDDMEIAGPDDDEAYEDDQQLEQVQQSEENDEETAAVAAVVAGAYPNATEEQKRELLKGLHEHGNAVLATLERWKTHGTTQQKIYAQMVIGYMQMKTLDEVGEPIPKNAPPTIQYLFKANQRDKLKQLAVTVHDKYAQDFYCRINWPKFDGFLVHINEVRGNKTGNEYANPALKKCAKTQVCVLSASQDALDRFQKAFNPKIDTNVYTFYKTTDPVAFAEKVHEKED
jgi:hypothetical protein